MGMISCNAHGRTVTVGDCDATALRSRQVLECDAEVLMLGVPGLALPDSALATAMLPSVPDMVDASIANSRLARRVARTPSPEAPTRPDQGTHPGSCRALRCLNQLGHIRSRLCHAA